MFYRASCQFVSPFQFQTPTSHSRLKLDDSNNDDSTDDKEDDDGDSGKVNTQVLYLRVRYIYRE